MSRMDSHERARSGSSAGPSGQHYNGSSSKSNGRGGGGSSLLPSYLQDPSAAPEVCACADSVLRAIVRQAVALEVDMHGPLERGLRILRQEAWRAKADSTLNGGHK